MRNNLKYLILILTIGIFIATVFIVKRNEQTLNSELHNQIIELTSPVNRQNRIDHVLTTGGRGYRKVSFGDNRRFIITHYQINRDLIGVTSDQRRELINEGVREQGILVFEENEQKQFELFWESEEENISMTLPILGIYDLTGDKIPEVIALWQNGKYESLFIYQFIDNGFNLITPLEQPLLKYESLIYWPIFNTKDSLIKIIDIDQDGILEIEMPDSIFLGLAPDGLTTKSKEVYHAYKWDGSEYYLWKEQETSFTSDGRDEFSVVNVIDRLE